MGNFGITVVFASEENETNVRREGNLIINTSSKLAETKEFEGYQFSNPQLTCENNDSLLLATVQNVTDTKKELCTIRIYFYDNNGDVIDWMGGLIADLEPGATTQLNASVTTESIVYAYDYKITLESESAEPSNETNVRREGNLIINTSSKLAETKEFEGYQFSNPQLTCENNDSLLLATVKNVTNTKKELCSIDICFYDNNGDIIEIMGGILADLEPGATTQLNASITEESIVYAYDYKIMNFVIIGSEPDPVEPVQPVQPKDVNLTHMFYDYEYTDPVTKGGITIYGNAASSKNESDKKYNKETTIYTDILASYLYEKGNNAKVKASTGKVIVGVTSSSEKPVLKKGKIVDQKAEQIAKAKIKNGQITVIATGKEKGDIYLWVMDTGKKGDYECCPIKVMLAPKKVEFKNTSGSKLNNLKIAKDTSVDIIVTGLVGKKITEDGTYTVTVDSNSRNYVEVKPTSDANRFTLVGTGLKNDKDTKVTIIFTCDQNSKQNKFSATITK
jgi:hypothetical protein